MKSTLLLLLITASTFHLQAQSSDIRISAEYGLSFTKLIHPEPRDEGFAPSFQAFLRNGFRLGPHVDLTVGIGYLQARHYTYTDFGGFQDLNYAKILRTHHYLGVPVGVSFRYGRFFVTPEIAIARNISNTAIQTTYTTDGQSFRDQYDDAFNSRFNHRYIVPVMLSIGENVELGSIHMTLGLRSHYCLTPVASVSLNQGHAFGLGAFGGLRF